MDLTAIFSEDRDECLEHYGVKGMKWGKRKSWSGWRRTYTEAEPATLRMLSRTISDTAKQARKAKGKNLVTRVFAKAKAKSTVSTVNTQLKKYNSSWRTFGSGGGKF